MIPDVMMIFAVDWSLDFGYSNWSKDCRFFCMSTNDRFMFFRKARLL